LVAAISRVGNCSSVFTIFFFGTNSDAPALKFELTVDFDASSEGKLDVY